MYTCPHCSAKSVPYSLFGVTECRSCHTRVQTRLTLASFLIPLYLLAAVLLRRFANIDIGMDTTGGLLLFIVAAALQLGMLAYKPAAPPREN